MDSKPSKSLGSEERIRVRKWSKERIVLILVTKEISCPVSSKTFETWGRGGGDGTFEE